MMQLLCVAISTKYTVPFILTNSSHIGFWRLGPDERVWGWIILFRKMEIMKHSTVKNKVVFFGLNVPIY